LAPTIDSLVTLLLIAVIVALVARRLKVPYTVGLVVAGFLLEFALPGRPFAINLTRELIFSTLLPPLLFESALNTNWKDIRRDLGLMLFLATIGVIVSALLVAFGMAHWVGWPIGSALVFGVLIAATDPVAVISLLREAGVTGRIRHLIETESLANDGTAATLFLIALPLALPGSPHFSLGAVMSSVLLNLLVQVIGGLLAGVVVGFLAIVLAGRTTDHLIETALTTVAAYGAFQIADRIHMSGILATVAAGLVLGNFGLLRQNRANVISERGREVVVAFWDFAAFLANSLIFLLIGLKLAALPFTGALMAPISFGIALMLAARAFTTYIPCALWPGGSKRLSPRNRHLLFWGGLRGALALALVLSLPNDLPLHDTIVMTTFGVVAFSILVQGTTTPILLRLLFKGGPKGMG